ncbi:MAG: RcpC/CpaB family pilus assembly protein [Elusimicrobiota bacterium]
MKTRAFAAAVLALACGLSGCRAKPRPPQPAAESSAAFAPPPGKRAFSLSIDKSQTRFLVPGDAAEIVILIETPRADGLSETRSEVLSPRAEVLRVRRDWGDDSGLVSLALTPEEAQYAALAAEREDRLFLNKLPEAARLEAARAPARPSLEAGRRGLAALVYADQQEFLEPGDRVDVIATRESGKASGKSELAAVTLFQDVEVLGSAAPEGNDQWATVQLMLTPEQARALTRAVASEDDIVLAVRAPGDRVTRPVEPAKMSRKFGTDAERSSPKS